MYTRSLSRYFQFRHIVERKYDNRGVRRKSGNLSGQFNAVHTRHHPSLLQLRPASTPRIFQRQQLEFWPLDAGSLDQLNIESHSAWLRHTDIPVGPKFL